MTIQQLLKTAPVTTLLLISFIGLFVVQVLSGADANNPSTEMLIKWGANALPFTMGDEPWRLVSSAFLHIGLMHLLFNGFAMYFFGQIAEPMFGSAKFLALFLLAAIGGNLLNSYVTWQGILDGNGQAGLSAGASGGIMGIGAALLVAAFFKISVNGLMLNLRSLLFIMGINLVYGFAVPGIDNAGHIGGAVTGLIIASAFAIAYRRRTVITPQNMPIPQHPYPMNEPSPYQANDQDTYQTHYIDQPSDVDTSYPSHHNAEFDTSTLETNFSTVHNTAISHKTQAKPSLFWTLLPWIVMLLISVGFVWWWQDIHYQIVEVLKTIE
ncbi:rhomboid family intramembrane serine protease [Psychrobacter alimentarius]|uniref:rhomboid family intramembrane serine protease n=1 Tax=Psychrobacter alimentarius TaxID=261164 RepID=UPI003FD27246